MPIILACTDGSTYAPSLYQHSGWAARRLAARVEVLHVLDHHRERAPAVDFSGSIGMDASAHLTEELTKLEEAQGRVQRLKGKAILEDAKHQLAAAGVTDIVTTQRHGTLVETLEELEPRCDLVAIAKRGTHADSAPGHLGANLERVVRTAVRPVLVTAQTFQPIERFLIAYDGGPSVARAIEFARKCAHAPRSPCWNPGSRRRRRSSTRRGRRSSWPRAGISRRSLAMRSSTATWR
jgi:hypothetical protein